MFDFLYCSKIEDRICISVPQHRSAIRKLSKGEMTSFEFKELLAATKGGYQWLNNVLVWVSAVCQVVRLKDTECIKFPKNKMGLLQFLKSISSTSPVCSYLPASSSDWVASVLRKPIKKDFFDWYHLENDCPILFNLLNEMTEDSFPDNFVAVILRLCDIAGKPFETSVPMLPPVTDTNEIKMDWLV